MNSAQHAKAQGALILNELNDLKRTVAACAQEMNWSEEIVQSVIDGTADSQTTWKLIHAIAQRYPVAYASLILDPDDCQCGIRVMRAADSAKSRRVFNRPNANGDFTPYYEYHDTALSRLGAFRPEWIAPLREVADANPQNPDVIYNNGHLLHQVTFFVGPINFCYEVDGEFYCVEMQTGDSNAIAPYVRHSFTTRHADEPGYIIAVTFGGELKRALPALYHLGANRLQTCRQLIENFDKAEQVTICRRKETLSVPVPNALSAAYRLWPAASVTAVANVTAGAVDVLTSQSPPLFPAGFLQTYCYHAGADPVTLHWQWEGVDQTLVLRPGDSVFIQPGIAYGFSTVPNATNATVFRVEIPGEINASVQTELSQLTHWDRVVQETGCWF